MDFEVRVIDEGGYLLCRVYRPVTISLARRFARAVDELHRQSGIHVFLFDLRGAPNTASVLDNYEYAYEDMAAMNLARNARSALLVDPDDHSHDFPETVMRNAGYIVRLFTDEAEAIAWLTP